MTADLPPGPWRYMPDEHDDWGYVRDANGDIVAPDVTTMPSPDVLHPKTRGQLRAMANRLAIPLPSEPDGGRGGWDVIPPEPCPACRGPMQRSIDCCKCHRCNVRFDFECRTVRLNASGRDYIVVGEIDAVRDWNDLCRRLREQPFL